MADKPFAEYAVRNAPPLLEVLQREFRDVRDVLEIGSGTGQHAVIFARELPHLQWHTSDLDENHSGIESWLAEAGLPNLHAPVSLDVRIASLEPASFDAVFSANTAHIMSIEAVAAMFSLVGDVLRAAGKFCLYGPFRRDGACNTLSNELFDSNLRSRDPQMGIRDLEILDEFGARCGLARQRLYAVPSNNYVATWTRRVNGGTA